MSLYSLYSNLSLSLFLLENRHGRYLGVGYQEPHQNLVPKVTSEVGAQDVLPILKDKNGAPENTSDITEDKEHEPREKKDIFRSHKSGQWH